MHGMPKNILQSAAPHCTLRTAVLKPGDRWNVILDTATVSYMLKQIWWSYLHMVCRRSSQRGKRQRSSRGLAEICGNRAPSHLMLQHRLCILHSGCTVGRPHETEVFCCRYHQPNFRTCNAAQVAYSRVLGVSTRLPITAVPHK